MPAARLSRLAASTDARCWTAREICIAGTRRADLAAFRLRGCLSSSNEPAVTAANPNIICAAVVPLVRCRSLCRIARRILLFEDQSVAGSRQIGLDHALARHRCAVKQHVLDADVIMKPFKVTQSRSGTCDVQMQGGSAMTGQINMKGLA